MTTILMILIGLLGSSLDNNIDQIRDDFHKLNNEQTVKQFIDKYEKSPLDRSKPYVAAAIMRQAEYTFFPHKKLQYFENGKKKLEHYINNHLNCVESRYVRVLVQSKTPSILGYKKNIDSDKNFILKNIRQADLPKKYQDLILKNIKTLL